MTIRIYEPDTQITRLANQAGVSDDAVRKLYRDAVHELSADARITDYVHMFACRRLRAVLEAAAPSNQH
jgi:hypothetical protein